MKKAGFFLAFSAVFFFLSSSNVFADDVVTGNASIETHVTNINNNGSVKSHVETTVNGKKDIEDSNQPGEMDVKNINGNVTVTKSLNPSITISPTPIATHSSAMQSPKLIRKNLVTRFFENISNLLKRIFNDL